MITDEERVIRSDDPFVKDRERGFELRRPGRQTDERPLLWVLNHRSRAVGERQRYDLLGICGQRKPSNDVEARHKRGATNEKLPSVDHQAHSNLNIYTAYDRALPAYDVGIVTDGFSQKPSRVCGSFQLRIFD